MKLIKIRPVLLAVLVLALYATPGNALIIDPPDLSRVYTGHLCGPGCWCSTRLDDYDVAAAPTDDDAFDQLMESLYPGWTVNYGGTLSGIVHIETYDAHVCDHYVLPSDWEWGNPIPERLSGHCSHGAELMMWYEEGPDDPDIPDDQSFHWIQRFFDWGGYCGYTEAPHDVIDCTQGPYYLDPAEEASAVTNGHPYSYYLDAPQAGCIFHGDSCPGDHCPGPCNWGADVWTYIAFGTIGASGTGTMTVYEGISWGFTANCVPVPEPSALLICGMGAWAVFLRRAVKPN